MGQHQVIYSPLDAVSAGIGYLSEDRKHFGLATGMDVRTNISMASLARYANVVGVLDESKMQHIPTDYIEKLDIRTPSDKQEVGFLSGGNQQNVVIAKWLLRECDVLIFDEPTRSVEVSAKAKIYKILAFASEERAIIVISSELPEIMRLSHRIAVMCEGTLTGILSGGEGITQEKIVHLATRQEPVQHLHDAVV